AYSEDGSELLYTTNFTRAQLNPTNTNTQKPDGATSQVETPTESATFNFPLPYGKYKIYAVANIPEQYVAYFGENQVPNETALKSISFPWNSNDIAANAEMFGWFSTQAFTSMNISGENAFDAPVVTINKNGVTLNAWLRRLASKVTVSFDPGNLNEGVTIYIKSATIRHIPANCTIGATNSPGSVDDLITAVDAEPTQIINYYTEGNENTPTKWLTLQKGTPVDLDKPHDANAESLFFFENCQGDKTGMGLSFNKEMNAKEMAENDYLPTGGNPDGHPDYVDYKDKVKYGTFIEVEAWYNSVNEEKLSSGPIRYRFMLGKNTTYNYDAERNYHYKLTLKFKGWANEPDWHIDYEEPKHGIILPEEYFISYLYKQTMNLPVRLTNADGIKYLRAEIVENNWAPYDPTQPDEVPATPTYNIYNYDEFTWYRDAWLKFKEQYNDWDKYRGKANFLGFLALRATTNTMIGDETTNYGPEAMTEIENYYCSNNKWWAEYDITKSGEDIEIAPGTDNGTYSVKRDGSDVIVQVPMWTRAKNLVQASGFTGNNPYNAYRRKAVVRFYAFDANRNPVYFEDIQGNKREYDEIPIYQVRRIVNPKAIWRAADNDDEFDIDLSVLWVANTNEFTSLTSSSGPWRASIMTSGTSKGGEEAWFTLTGNGRTVTKVCDDNTANSSNYIEGSGGSYMRFKYKPNGTIGKNEARYGIIKIEYMNYTCVHLILVRQGYDARTRLGSKDWSCYNVYAMNGKNTNDLNPQPRSKVGNNMNVITTASPLSVGTMFKRANYEQGILEVNNRDYGLYYPIYNTPLQLIKLNDDGTTSIFKKKWNEMPAYGAKQYGGGDSRLGDEYSWAETYTAIDRNNQKFTIPSYDDFTELMNLEQGFGVVYADGATATADYIDQAYTYYDTDNKGSRTTNNQGMRGCVIYDPDNGNQIFFPMGVEGQARRARQISAVGSATFPDLPGTSTTASIDEMRGALSYSGVFGVLRSDKNIYRPVVYNLYRNQGAIYWFIKPEKGGHKPTGNYSYSWDMNYYSFDFSSFDDATLGTGVTIINDDYKPGMAQASDALPIRLIY
ncbi:MAG: hypothetical protein K2H39_06975, partial [Paramuribaculum sp.]|nr:hypothetical protein [Paramuribaculum sp.]